MTSTVAIFPHCCGLSSAGSAANAIADTVYSLTDHVSGTDRHSVAFVVMELSREEGIDFLVLGTCA